MKLKQLVAGVATGYVTKAVQFFVSIALVPFLLRPDVLGVDEYGRAFTLIAFMTIGTVLTAGIRLSFVRTISQAIGDDQNGTQKRVGPLLGSGTAFLILLCTALALLALLFENALLDFVRFPENPDYKQAVRFALLWMAAENAFFLFRAPLMARGAISYVNAIATLEVLLRSGSLVVLLPNTESPLSAYFLVQFFYASLRNIGYVSWSVVNARSDLSGMTRGSLADIKDTVLYSWSITLAEGASFLVRRVPIMLASRYLGATEAGYIAIVINTIQSYILQILFAVVQPLAIPIAARFDPRKISATARSFFFDVEGLYCAAVILVVTMLTVLAPELISIWLGDGYESIVLPAQIMLGGCGFDIMYSIRKSLLIGQGLLPEAISRIVGLAILTACASALSVLSLAEWTYAVFAIGVYLVLSNVIGIGSIWARHFNRSDEAAPGYGRFLAFIPIFVVALFSSRFVGNMNWQQDALAALGVLGFAIICIATFIISVQSILRTLNRLGQSLDRDVFGS